MRRSRRVGLGRGNALAMYRKAPSRPLMAFWMTSEAMLPSTRSTDLVSRFRRSRIEGREAEMTTSGINPLMSGTRPGAGAGAGAGGICESRTRRGIWSEGRGRSRRGGPGSRWGSSGRDPGSIPS